MILGVAASWQDYHGLSKGIHLFIQLAKILPDDIKIILIGRPDNSLTLPVNILSIPYVNGVKELSYYYSLADVFVQMSREETFGKVTAEALSCGTPVIVFNTTANPELVGQNCGAIVTDSDINEMFIKILKILSNGREKYSIACRMFAECNFDAKKIVEQFVQLYHDLLIA